MSDLQEQHQVLKFMQKILYNSSDARLATVFLLACKDTQKNGSTGIRVGEAYPTLTVSPTQIVVEPLFVHALASLT